MQGGGAGGQGGGVTSFYPMLRTIADADVEIVEQVRLASGDNGHVRLEGIFGEPGRSIVPDHLVTWNGGEPDLTLSAQLNALGVEHTIIGDAGDRAASPMRRRRPRAPPNRGSP